MNFPKSYNTKGAWIRKDRPQMPGDTPGGSCHIGDEQWLIMLQRDQDSEQMPGQQALFRFTVDGCEPAMTDVLETETCEGSCSCMDGPDADPA